MYELVICAGTDGIDWLRKIEREVCGGGNAVTACSLSGKRACLCIGADRRSAVKVKKLAEKALNLILLGEIKSMYIGKRINRLHICSSSRMLLVHALARFDCEAEEGMLRESMEIGKIFDLDGFRHFRMRDFYSRWDEICELACRHGDFLSDESAFGDLIRFLVDSGKRRGARAEVYRMGGKYRLIERTPDTDTEERMYDELDALICRLIDFAPSETILGGFGNDADYKKLSSIFDVSCNILR